MGVAGGRLKGKRAIKNAFRTDGKAFQLSGTPTGIRTPVAAVKGQCPRPLDDGRVTESRTITKAPVIVNVAAGGIERQQSGAVRFESVWFMVRQSLLRAAQ